MQGEGNHPPQSASQMLYRVTNVNDWKWKREKNSLFSNKSNSHFPNWCVLPTTFQAYDTSETGIFSPTLLSYRPEPTSRREEKRQREENRANFHLQWALNKLEITDGIELCIGHQNIFQIFGARLSSEIIVCTLWAKIMRPLVCGDA